VNRKAGAAIATITVAGGLVVACAHVTHSVTHASKPAASASPSAAPVSPPAVIYKYLPFGQAQFNAAYTAAGHAGAQYETFSYTDTPASYGSRIAPYVTPGYLTALEQTFGNAQATAARGKAKEQSSAMAAVTSMRAFGPTSITFITYIKQADPVTQDSGDYAITVQTTDGKQWLVSEIAPASEGNS